MSRTYAIAVSLGVCLMVLWPIRVHFMDQKPDSFPLTWYPMFRGVRSPLESPPHVVGLDAEGAWFPIPYTYWASGGFNQGRAQLRRVLAMDAGRRAELCQKIAQKVRKNRRPVDETLVEVQIWRSQYSRDEYFSERKRDPRRKKVIASCPVEREGT